MPRFAVKDPLLDAQALRAAGAASSGGADVGECLAAARRVGGTDLNGWYQAWSALAGETEQLAQRAEADGQVETARLAWFRACTYHRTAGVMLMGTPLDDRLVDSYRHQREAFRRGAAMLAQPPEVLEIPFEDDHLPTYFFKPPGAAVPRPTVILLNGYDGTAEELYFFNGAAALARGYNVLAFDGPGQGSMLIERGVPMRPDYHVPIGAIVDHLLTRPQEVDPGRIALIGMSLGGHLGPRAAAGEHRLAALVSDCGAFDLYAAFLERLPGPLRSGFDRGKGWARSLVAKALASTMRKPTDGWALRRGTLVHGVDDPMAYIDTIRAFTLDGIAEQISCPTFVCYAEGDDISATMPRFAEGLRVDHELVRFTASEGADSHCEVGARLLVHARTFDWLDRVLERRI